MFWGTVERKMKKNILMAAMTALLGTQAFASLTMLTDRSQISATADLGMGQFGNSFDPVANGSIGTTTGIDVFGVKITGPSDMERRDQDNGWAGAFASGEQLLWTKLVDGPVTFNLAKSAQAVGLELQRDFFSQYDATIEAYDGLGVSLGSFTYEDVAAFDKVFVGVRSSDNNILSFKINVVADDGLGTDFAFNHASIECCSAVPEPATMSALGLGALALLRRKRNS